MPRISIDLSKEEDTEIYISLEDGEGILRVGEFELTLKESDFQAINNELKDWY